MKKLYDFTIWQWHRWDNWEKVYFSSLSLIVFGIFIPGLIGTLFLTLGLLLLLTWMSKWALWDSLIKSFNEFEKERKMKAQTPAEGILKTREWPGAKSYHIECECTSTDHSASMWIEVDNDKETKDIQLSFYVDTWTPFWDKGFNRFKAAWDILVKGVNKQEHHMILRKQVALNLSEVIKKSIKELEDGKN